MRCEDARELLSAGLDGEVRDREAVHLDAHLAACPACVAHRAALEHLHRTARLRAAEPVPDLTAPIVAALAGRLPVHRAGGGGARHALLAVALTQLVLALPQLVLAAGDGVPTHVARELGAFDLALAAGLLVAAWQPARAPGLVPMAAALAAAVVGTAVADVAAGDATLADESHHALEVVGMALLWVVARRQPRPSPARAPLPA